MLNKRVGRKISLFRSRDFFVKIKGQYALFSDPATKGGGEKYSYSIPTRQALTGLADALYYKPTIKNIVSEVKVINKIQTEVIGTRAMINKSNKMEADLNYVSYLIDVEYLMKFHFLWDETRVDLTYDRNSKKHEAIMERSIIRGGRRDIFLGTRECVATAEHLTEQEYEKAESYYSNQILNMGIMFQEFEYPTIKGQSLKSYFANTILDKGVIRYSSKETCNIINELSDYGFKQSQRMKSVETEWKEYQAIEEGE